MSIKRVSIASDFGLEGILRENKNKAGVVICHPHPLYGGCMDNNVVDAIDDGFFKKGFTTLRFNFRGVGMSGGAYDGGKGEVRDVLASLAFLKEKMDDDAIFVLAGYSFGAWIVSMAALAAENISSIFIVSYPFTSYSTEAMNQFRGQMFFTGGMYDEISPVDSLLKFYKAMPVVDKYLKIIPTDHFYRGKEKEIEEFIINSLNPAFEAVKNTCSV